MNPSSFVYLLVLYFFLMPLFSMAHEMGHVVAAFNLTNQRVLVRMGSRGPRLNLRLGRLTLDVRFGSDSSFTVYRLFGSGLVTTSRRLLVALGGPFCTLLLLALFTAAALVREGHNPWLAACGWANGLLLLTSLLPWHYPAWMGACGGQPSDGLRVVHAWQELRQQRRHEELG